MTVEKTAFESILNVYFVTLTGVDVKKRQRRKKPASKLKVNVCTTRLTDDDYAILSGLRKTYAQDLGDDASDSAVIRTAIRQSWYSRDNNFIKTKADAISLFNIYTNVEEVALDEIFCSHEPLAIMIPDISLIINRPRLRESLTRRLKNNLETGIFTSCRRFDNTKESHSLSGLISGLTETELSNSYNVTFYHLKEPISHFIIAGDLVWYSPSDLYPECYFCFEPDYHKHYGHSASLQRIWQILLDARKRAEHVALAHF